MSGAPPVPVGVPQQTISTGIVTSSSSYGGITKSNNNTPQTQLQSHSHHHQQLQQQQQHPQYQIQQQQQPQIQGQIPVVYYQQQHQYTQQHQYYYQQQVPPQHNYFTTASTQGQVWAPQGNNLIQQNVIPQQPQQYYQYNNYNVQGIPQAQGYIQHHQQQQLIINPCAGFLNESQQQPSMVLPQQQIQISSVPQLMQGTVRSPSRPGPGSSPGAQMMPVRLQNMSKGARTKAGMRKLIEERIRAASDSVTAEQPKKATKRKSSEKAPSVGKGNRKQSKAALNAAGLISQGASEAATSSVTSEDGSQNSVPTPSKKRRKSSTMTICSPTLVSPNGTNVKPRKPAKSRKKTPKSLNPTPAELLQNLERNGEVTIIPIKKRQRRSRAKVPGRKPGRPKTSLSETQSGNVDTNMSPSFPADSHPSTQITVISPSPKKASTSTSPKPKAASAKSATKISPSPKTVVVRKSTAQPSPLPKAKAAARKRSASTKDATNSPIHSDPQPIIMQSSTIGSPRVKAPKSPRVSASISSNATRTKSRKLVKPDSFISLPTRSTAGNIFGKILTNPDITVLAPASVSQSSKKSSKSLGSVKSSPPKNTSKKFPTRVSVSKLPEGTTKISGLSSQMLRELVMDTPLTSSDGLNTLESSTTTPSPRQRRRSRKQVLDKTPDIDTDCVIIDPEPPLPISNTSEVKIEGPSPNFDVDGPRPGPPSKVRNLDETVASTPIKKPPRKRKNKAEMDAYRAGLSLDHGTRAKKPKTPPNKPSIIPVEVKEVKPPTIVETAKPNPFLEKVRAEKKPHSKVAKLRVFGPQVQFYRGSDEEEIDPRPKPSIPKKKLCQADFDHSVPWSCVFCHFGQNELGLGVLFGPYYIETIRDGQICKRETWLHLDCSLWAPGVILVGPTLRGLEQGVREAENQICKICSKGGATIGCLKRRCSEAVHFPCAQLNGWVLDEPTFHSYCPEHKATASFSKDHVNLLQHLPKFM